LTLRENTRLSLLTLYASLTPEQKQALTASSALQKLTTDTQQFSLDRRLLSQSIGPTSSVMQTEYGQALPPFLIEKFKGLKPSDFRFAITGPSKSGKSTLLWAAATVFFQKLQISGDHENYLLFPVNWLVHQRTIDDIPRLYKLVVATAIASLKSLKLEFVPVFDILQQWLVSIVMIPTFPAFPPPLLHVASFPKDVVSQLGQRIHRYWNQRNDFAGFVRALLAVPYDLAAAFGFKNVVFVFDHLDVCDRMLEPLPRFDREENKTIAFSEFISEALEKSMYFVATKDDGVFFRIFAAHDSRQLTTERLIEKQSDREIVIADPRFSLTFDMCHGCPGYCALFDRVYEIVRKSQGKKENKTLFAKLKPVVDSARRESIRHEVIRLCSLLAQTDTDDALGYQLMSELDERKEIEARVR
jgi:hypothetical protein